ncbi:MAG: hypothetical protein AB7U20_17260 [Planctomycetaceae bacterium]
MTQHNTLLTVSTCTLLSLSLCGCPQATNGVSSGNGTAPSAAHDDHDHPHAHPSEGPHHGELIELGNEEYHAELLHSETEVTIYLLDGAAAKTVPIDAAAITLNLTHDGTPGQFSLDASPDAGDPDGRSSRFVSTDPELLGHINEEHLEFRLVVTIDGKSYNGRFEHSHAEHAAGGHNHAH